MALLWFEGFENYDSFTSQTWRDSINSLEYIYSDGAGSTTRRTGEKSQTQAWNHPYSMDVATLSGGTPATIFFGFAHRHNANPAYHISRHWIRIFDTWASSNCHLSFYITDSKTISVRDGAGGLLGTSSGHTLQNNTWYYIEIKVTIHDSAGAITIIINGVERLALTDKDTKTGSNAYVGRVHILGVNGAAVYYDDIYLCDDTGGREDDFLGDVRVDPLRADGVGNTTQFAPSAGSNYQNVDEITVDNDVTYNDGDLGEKDTYAVQSLPSPSGTTIYGVKNQMCVRKTDVGDRSVKLITRAGGTDYQGGTKVLTDTYQQVAELYVDNPADSLAWEDADIDSMEVGIEVTV